MYRILAISLCTHMFKCFVQAFFAPTKTISRKMLIQYNYIVPVSQCSVSTALLLSFYSRGYLYGDKLAPIFSLLQNSFNKNELTNTFKSRMCHCPSWYIDLTFLWSILLYIANIYEDEILIDLMRRFPCSLFMGLFVTPNTTSQRLHKVYIHFWADHNYTLITPPLFIYLSLHLSVHRSDCVTNLSLKW